MIHFNVFKVGGEIGIGILMRVEGHEPRTRGSSLRVRLHVLAAAGNLLERQRQQHAAISADFRTYALTPITSPY